MRSHDVHTLIKKYIFTKNAKGLLSLQKGVILSLVGGLALMLTAAAWSEWWLLKAIGVAVAIS